MPRVVPRDADLVSLWQVEECDERAPHYVQYLF